MKKALFLSLCSSALALSGVAAAIGGSQAQKTFAGASTTLYLNVSNVTWWEGAEAKTYALFTNDIKDNAKAGAFGTLMTAVSGVDHTYSVEVSGSYKYVYFNRVSSDETEILNSSGGTAKPLEIPADLTTTNIWWMKADTTNWGDVQGNDAAGYWSHITPSLTNGIYLKGENGSANGVALGWVAHNHVYAGAPFELTAGSIVKGQYYYQGSPTDWYNIESIVSEDPTYYPVNFASEGNNAEVTNAGVYTLSFDWAKTEDDRKYYKYTFGNSATDWAKEFLDSMTCNADGLAEPEFKVGYSWPLLAEKYDALDDYAKDTFYRAAANPSGTKIEEAVSRYLTIVSNHHYEPFMKDSSNSVRSEYVSAPLFTTKTDDSVMGITIAVATFALVGFGAVLAIRKRKAE